MHRVVELESVECRHSAWRYEEWRSGVHMGGEKSCRAVGLPCQVLLSTYLEL